MREAGDVCYTDVLRDGTGVVEFARYEDMKYALRKLDDTKFKSHEVCFESHFAVFYLRFRKGPAEMLVIFAFFVNQDFIVSG